LLCERRDHSSDRQTPQATQNPPECCGDELVVQGSAAQLLDVDGDGTLADERK
jgi:hypothetical protein